jgi:type III secretion protein C
MSVVHQIARAAWLAVVAASAAAMPGAAAGRPMQFPTGSYSYAVIDQDLRDLLTEYGRNINVAVQLSDEIHGHLRGPLPVATAQEFLDRLCERFGLVWYYDGSVLSVSLLTELRTELIDIGKAPARAVSDKLASLDVLDPRFPVKVTADPAMVSVSGPPPYVSRLRETVTMLARSLGRPGEQEDNRVRVYRGGL